MKLQFRAEKEKACNTCTVDIVALAAGSLVLPGAGTHSAPEGGGDEDPVFGKSNYVGGEPQSAHSPLAG